MPARILSLLLFISGAGFSWTTQTTPDPLDAEVYIYDGGSIYHKKDCLCMTGRVHIRPVKLRELGKGWDPDPFCNAPRRPADAPPGPIAAEYLNLFLPPPPKTQFNLPLPTAASAEAMGGIRAKCAAEWPTDFELRAHCEDHQHKALALLGARTMSTPNQTTIRNKCRSDWLTDYELQNYCEEHQLVALARVGGGQ